MKKLLFIVVLFLPIIGCVSTPPMSEENKAFELEVSTKIAYSLRGLYSIGAEFDNDPAYNDFMDTFLDGSVTLISVSDVDYRASVEKTGESFTIKIKNVFDLYESPASKMTYLTAVLGTVAKMEIVTGTSQNNELLKERFISIVNMYKEYYQGVSFENDSWHVENQMNVDGNIVF